MSYQAPSVDAAGLHLPAYPDFLGLLQGGYLAIYGQTVNLGDDAADHQWISAIALALADAMAAAQLAYNQASPQTAVGAGQDSLYKLNGISRDVASQSTCQVTLIGTPGAVITNGVVQDTVYSLLWDLPDSVIIGPSGSTVATVTCEKTGAFNITAPGQLSVIVTTQAGWTGVDNGIFTAVVGKPVETNSQFRSRQAISTELPSQTLVAATEAAVAATLPAGNRYSIEENYTGATDSNGCPPHSITVIAEGGDAATIASTILIKKTPGAFTNGTTAVSVVDPDTGFTYQINFDEISAPAIGSGPGYLPIYVTINVHQLPGCTASTLAAIQTAVTNYLNSLQIGEDVTQSALYAVGMSATPSLINPLYSIRAVFLGLAAGPSGTADLVVPYNQVAQSASVQIVQV